MSSEIHLDLGVTCCDDGHYELRPDAPTCLFLTGGKQDKAVFRLYQVGFRCLNCKSLVPGAGEGAFGPVKCLACRVWNLVLRVEIAGGVYWCSVRTKRGEPPTCPPPSSLIV